MITCYDMRCKYCNSKYRCTNKNVELDFVGINTVYQGFKELLECKSYEPSDIYLNAQDLIAKMRAEQEKNN